MEANKALAAFSALSQSTRLDVFRLLIEAEPSGRLAGEISTALSVRQNTLSANLSILLNAGLVRNEREGRTIRYFANVDAIQGLVRFLLNDCCGGRPEICCPILDNVRSLDGPTE